MEIQFWSQDNRFGVKIGSESVRGILRYCEQSTPNETGGILLGRYSLSHDCALVQTVTGPPADSQMGRSWFVRGVRGLQAKLNALWHRKAGFYLGEWHFHPFGQPIPSTVDAKQLHQIAESRFYQCPEPLLIILGGDPLNSWTMRSFLFRRRHKSPIELSYLSGRNASAYVTSTDHLYGSHCARTLDL